MKTRSLEVPTPTPTPSGGGPLMTVFCPYEQRDVPISECQGCDKKEECPRLSGW